MKIFMTRMKQISTNEISLIEDHHYPSYVNQIKRWLNRTENNITTLQENAINELFNKEEIQYFKELSKNDNLKNGVFIASGASEWAGSALRMTHCKPEYSGKIGFKGLINIMAGQLANKLGFTSYVASDATACISSLKIIDDAILQIQSGRLDRALLIGWDDTINSATLDVFGFTGASLTKKQYDSGILPSAFDNINGGFFIGNGVAYILLESEKAIESSKNEIHAEVISTYIGAEVNTNPIALTYKGYYDTMNNCLERSELNKEDILFVKSHGSGTSVNNEAELKAFNMIFENTETKITAYKPEIGHTMGASGLIETIIALNDLKENKIRSIKNNTNSNPQIVSNDIILEDSKNKYIMLNGSGMGNVFASVIIKTPE